MENLTTVIPHTQDTPPVLDPELHPIAIPTPTTDQVKTRKPRGPDKKPRKRKSDALNLLLEANNGSEGSSASEIPNPLHDDMMVEVGKVMDYLLDSIAPKKRKRGPNKNPKAKRIKLEESQEMEFKLEASQAPYSFPSVSVPQPQQSMPFVMKTVEELLPNWNFNNYILGLPYQLANPNEVSLNMMFQEATKRINAFNQLTDPTSSTYDPTLSSRQKAHEVPVSAGTSAKVEPCTLPTQPSVKTPIPNQPPQHHGGPPMHPQMAQHFHMQQMQSMNPTWQHMAMMQSMNQQQYAAVMTGNSPMSNQIRTQFQELQNPGASTPHQPQLNPVRFQQPMVPINPMAHPSTSSNPALQAHLQFPHNLGASTPHQSQSIAGMPQPMHSMNPMTNPTGFSASTPQPQAQLHYRQNLGAPTPHQSQMISVKPEPMLPIRPIAHPTGFPNSDTQSQTQFHARQNLGAPTPQFQPTPPNLMTHPSGSSNPASQGTINPALHSLTPLTIQNLQSHAQSLQNQAPQCSSSGRTTATLTPGLNAISDSSNNSSPTC